MADSSQKGAEYDADYFERGVSSGKSGYQDYRWMPERTIPFAHKIIRNLELRDGDRVLDYGCAKGFMVHAFRLLDIDAYGCDISQYAIEKAHPGTEDYLRIIGEDGKIPFEDDFFRQIIAKDVYEHLPEDILRKTLSESARISDRLFTIVPLGDGKKYVVPSYEYDVTHIHRQPTKWWEKKFEDAGWRVDRFSYLVSGMKQNYSQFLKGNGFFSSLKD